MFLRKLLFAISLTCLCVAVDLEADRGRLWAETPSESGQPGQRKLSASLSSLGGSWRILNAEQVSALSNIAVVGAVDDPRALGLVLVESIRGLNLTDYATAVLENSTLDELLIESVDELEFKGFKSLRIVYSGDESNGRFRYLSYIFLAHGKAYQVVAGGPVGLVTAQTLEPFSRAVAFTEMSDTAIIKRRVADITGLGWRVKSGVFSHVLSNLKIASGEGWSPIVGEALSRINGEAIAGLQKTSSQLNILFFDRPCPHSDRTLCLIWARQDLMSDLNLEEGVGSFDFNYLGEPRTFIRLTHQGGLYSYLLNEQIVADRVLQTLAWTISHNREKPKENDERSIVETAKSVEDHSALLWGSMQSGLSRVSKMGREERLKLNVELIKTPADRVSVEAMDSWMWGLYHHFESGLRWSKPSGMWRVNLSSAYPRSPRDRLLTIETPRYGLKSQLRVISGHHLRAHRSHDRLWGELVAQLLETRGQCASPDKGQRPLAGTKSHWTRCLFKKVSIENGVSLSREWTYQLDSFEAHGAVIHLLSWAPKSLFEKEAEPAREALERGLKINLPATVALSPHGVMSDERLRYEVRFPSGGTLRVHPTTSLGSVASQAEYHTADLSLVAFAVGEMKSSKLAELVNQITKSQRKVSSSKGERSSAAVPVRTQFWSHGERGERLRWSHESGPVQRGAILISAPPLVYGLVAVGRAESVEEALKGDRLKILR